MNYIKIDESNKTDFASVLPEEFSKAPYISLGAYEEDGSVCGAVALSFDGTQYDMEWLYVSPQKRRTGVGFGLVKEVRSMIMDIGFGPISAQFEVGRGDGLYPFFLSISNPEFLVDVVYSHDRYVVSAKDFLDSTVAKNGEKNKIEDIENEIKNNSVQLFWDMEEELREKALQKTMKHLSILDEDIFAKSCEKPLCFVAQKDQELLSFLIAQNTPSGGIYLSYLYSKEPKALMAVLQAAAVEMKENYGEQTLFFDAVTGGAQSMAEKIFPHSVKRHIYEAEF